MQTMVVLNSLVLAWPCAWPPYLSCRSTVSKETLLCTSEVLAQMLSLLSIACCRNLHSAIMTSAANLLCMLQPDPILNENMMCAKCAAWLVMGIVVSIVYAAILECPCTCIHEDCMTTTYFCAQGRADEAAAEVRLALLLVHLARCRLDGSSLQLVSFLEVLLCPSAWSA